MGKDEHVDKNTVDNPGFGKRRSSDGSNGVNGTNGDDDDDDHDPEQETSEFHDRQQHQQQQLQQQQPKSATSRHYRDSIQITDSNGHPSLFLDIDATDGDYDDTNGNYIYSDYDDGNDDNDGNPPMSNQVRSNNGIGHQHHHSSSRRKRNMHDEHDEHEHEHEHDEVEHDIYDDLSPPRYRCRRWVSEVLRRSAALTKCIWMHIQSTRSQARQRRANLLLERPTIEDDEDRLYHMKRSVLLCCSSTCDDTDCGIAVVIVFVVVWGFVLWVMKESNVRRELFLSGLLFLLVRLCSRPVWNSTQRCHRRRRLQYQYGRKRRSDQQHIPVAVPQDSPTKTTDLEMTLTSSSLSAMIKRTTATTATTATTTTTKDGIFRHGGDDGNDPVGDRGSGSSDATINTKGRRGINDDDHDEESALPTGIFLTASEESDPTIAAI